MKSKRTKLSEKCGDCLGFDYVTLFEGNGLCEDRGMSAATASCPSYRPNVFQLASLGNAGSTLPILAQAIKTIPTAKLRLFASVIANERTTRRYGFNFFDVVYYRYRGTSSSQYMSNFMKAHVLYATSDYIYLTDPSLTMRMTVINHRQKKGPTLYTAFNFMQLRQKMVDSGHSVDPHLKRSNNTTPEADEGHISDMTSVVEHNVKVNGRRREPKEEHAPHDLIRIFSTLQRGHYVSDDNAMQLAMDDEQTVHNEEPEEEELSTFTPPDPVDAKPKSKGRRKKQRRTKRSSSIRIDRTEGFGE